MTDSGAVVTINPKRRRGRKPRPNADTETLRKVHLRLPEALYLRLEAAAQANYRTVVQEVHMRLAQGEAKHDGLKPDQPPSDERGTHFEGWGRHADR